MTHNLKLNIGLCTLVLSGKKSFEIRKNDRNFQEGDTVVFTPWDPLKDMALHHPIEYKSFIITYITSFEQKDDFIVMAIKKI